MSDYACKCDICGKVLTDNTIDKTVEAHIKHLREAHQGELDRIAYLAVRSHSLARVYAI